MSEHRVTMLGASWRRVEDPSRSRDPRVRALVGALATLPAPEPRAEFRAELRAQLVAIAPRIIAESADANPKLVDIVPLAGPATAAQSGPARPRHTDSVLARLRGIRIGRPLVVVASVITVFAMLLGGAVWMSKKALPGDTLYGLKRASENAQLALAGSDTEKARLYLEQAETRVGEVGALLRRATGSAAGAQASGLDSHTADLISSTLGSADSDVRSASSLLATHAVKTDSAGSLDVMTEWAPGQLARLRAVAAAMPDATLRERTESSASLVSKAWSRAAQLAPKIGTSCLDTASKDDLGPVPAAGCVTTPTTPSVKPSSRPNVHPATSGSASASGSSAGSGSLGSAPGTTPETSPAAPAPSGSKDGLHLPSLPVPSLPSVPTSLPIDVSTCGLGVTLGPLIVGLSKCTGVKVSLHP